MKSMKKLVLVTALASLGLAGWATAEEQEKQISVFISQDNDEAAKVDLKVDGDVAVFQLPELAEGETKVITTKNGKNLTIQKLDGKLSIDIDGEPVVLPDLGGDHMMARIHSVPDMLHHRHKGLRIMGDTLTKEQRQAINDALLATGYDKKVLFIESDMVFVTEDSENVFKHSSDGGDVKVERIVIKKTEKDN